LIFKGINKALDMLGGDAEGSHLIVASDGEETEEPKIPNVTQRVNIIFRSPPPLMPFVIISKIFI
jgi:hypothetical protein